MSMSEKYRGLFSERVKRLLVEEAVHLTKLWMEDNNSPILYNSAGAEKPEWDTVLLDALFTAKANIVDEVSHLVDHTWPSEVWDGLGMSWIVENESKGRNSDKISKP